MLAIQYVFLSFSVLQLLCVWNGKSGPSSQDCYMDQKSFMYKALEPCPAQSKHYVFLK